MEWATFEDLVGILQLTIVSCLEQKPGWVWKGRQARQRFQVYYSGYHNVGMYREREEAEVS